jgi:hypothetical protein
MRPESGNGHKPRLFSSQVVAAKAWNHWKNIDRFESQKSGTGGELKAKLVKSAGSYYNDQPRFTQPT